MNNRSVLLVSTALEGMDDVSSVQRREKGSATKSAIPCPIVVRLYNNSMGGVDLMDQTNYSISVRSQIICSFLSPYFL